MFVCSLVALSLLKDNGVKDYTKKNIIEEVWVVGTQGEAIPAIDLFSRFCRYSVSSVTRISNEKQTNKNLTKVRMKK